MINKSILAFLMCLIFSSSVLSNEIDCSKFKKLSAKYIECNATKLKEKTNTKVKIINKKFEKSAIKDKFKKFKDSKTLTDLTKD